MSRFFKILTVALSLTLIVPSVWGVSTPKYRMRSPLVRLGAAELPPPQAGGRIGSAATAATITPGTQMGSTYYDYQHNGSTGRQVDQANGQIQVSWMKGTTAGLSLRTVNWNRVNVTGSPADFTLDDGRTIRRLPLGAALLAEGQAFNLPRPGYTNYRNRPGGKAVAQYHNFPEAGSGGNKFWEVQLDLAAGNGVFAGTPSGAPIPVGPEYGAESPVWPKQAISQCGGDLVHHGTGTHSGSPNEVWYWRGIINDGAGTITWDVSQPTFLGVIDAFITNVVEANGDNVQVFMFTGVNNTNQDLVRFVSTDCGVSWGPMENITNYSVNDVEGGNVDIDVVYDDAGNIHAIFDTAPADGSVSPTNLYHWSVSTGLRLITSAGWTNTCVGGTITNIGSNNGAGTNNLAIAEPSISVKPAGVHGIGDELLYAVWTQYGPTDDDCATVDDVGTPGGHVNSEIYCSVSSNGGLTWDRPTNLTGTITPDCLPGDCYSESWTTTAAKADSGVYISYVDDRHSGPIVFSGGAWVDNPYMVLAAEARIPVLEPVIAVNPNNYIELRANPGGGIETVDLSIISVGNANLDFNVTVTNDNGGASHLLVNGGGSYSNSIVAGGAPDIVTVSYDAVGLGDPEELAWRLEVTSNDPTNDPGQGGTPIDVTLQVFSASVWNVCTDSTLATSSHQMQVSSCLEMGDVGTTGQGFFNSADSSEWMYSGSPVITRVTGAGDTVAYHNAFMNLSDRTRALNKSFRAQSPFNVTRDSTVTVGDSTYTADVAFGTSSTTDTTMALDYEIVFPKTPSGSRGAIWKFSMSSATGAPLSGVSYGVAADIDLDPGAGENAGAGNAGLGWIGGVGGESDTSGTFMPNTNYMGIAHLPLTGPGCDVGGAAAAQVLANPNYVHPENAYNTDSLHGLFTGFGALSTWGTNIHIDTGQVADDISVMLVSGYDEVVDNATATEWGYILAVSNVSTGDLETTLFTLRALATVNCQLGDCAIDVSGDVNVSGALTSADIIYMVNFVFKGDDPPLPCAANGDVNCSGAVTSADIIFLVNHVFKGDIPPCDICNDPNAQACTP